MLPNKRATAVHWARRQLPVKTLAVYTKRNFRLVIRPLLADDPVLSHSGLSLSDPSKGRLDGIETVKDLISKDPNNAIKQGTDGLLYTTHSHADPLAHYILAKS